MGVAQLNKMRVLKREKSAGEVKFWISAGDITYIIHTSNNLFDVLLMSLQIKTGIRSFK
jgi:hypothetical protein